MGKWLVFPLRAKCLHQIRHKFDLRMIFRAENKATKRTEYWNVYMHFFDSAGTCIRMCHIVRVFESLLETAKPQGLFHQLNTIPGSFNGISVNVLQMFQNSKIPPNSTHFLWSSQHHFGPVHQQYVFIQLLCTWQRKKKTHTLRNNVRDKKVNNSKNETNKVDTECAE